MRKLFFALLLCMAVGLFAAPSRADLIIPSLPNWPGSLLAYPLIDNIHGVTIFNIANTHVDEEVYVECYIITHGVDGAIDEKKDFVIKLTPKEKFVWITSNPYDQRGNQIQGFDGRKGYMFCFAIDNPYDQREITFNYLKGDATVLNLGTASAFNYNAIPHQRLAGLFSMLEGRPSSDVTGERFTGCATQGDRMLRLDGCEYTAATSQIMFEGLAEIPGMLYGTLAVASPGLDFVDSEQPEFDINVYCWNEVETKFSRHLKFKDFAQYDLTKDLQLDIHSIFTLGWQCTTTTTHPLWAVLHQSLGTVFGWGGNVFLHPTTGVAATITLPPVPLQ